MSGTVWDRTRGVVAAFGEATAAMFSPRIRLGVTGLARSGKTVFTTALVHHLLGGTRMPVFRASAEGRIARARLAIQPDADVPRFPYETHLATLTAGAARRWPDSTKRISELRIEIDYEGQGRWFGGPSTLTLDIVDYPGEWLLDLPLMEMSYARWAAASFADARRPHRSELSAEWLAAGEGADALAPAAETLVEELSAAFKSHLSRLRADPEAVAVQPPGRFLMPGDLEGSPALTFAPLDVTPDAAFPAGSLGALMEARFEAYKRIVVRPFFHDHFSRLDRQIVLVDMLSALDAGPGAVADLETALGQVLAAFRVGQNRWLSQFVAPRIDKVLFAATKADHLHHTSHDRLEALMRRVTERAISRALGAGAQVECMALAAVRATREARIREGGEELPAIVGTPEAGEHVGAELFDGNHEAAVFPGELPTDAAALLAPDSPGWHVRAPRFRPPPLEADKGGRLPPLPHIRLDRALESLLGDRLA